MKTLVLVFSILFAVSTLTLNACGTVAGIGDDIKSSAEWTRDKMSSKKKGD